MIYVLCVGVLDWQLMISILTPIETCAVNSCQLEVQMFFDHVWVLGWFRCKKPRRTFPQPSETSSLSPPPPRVPSFFFPPPHPPPTLHTSLSTTDRADMESTEEKDGERRRRRVRERQFGYKARTEVETEKCCRCFHVEHVVVIVVTVVSVRGERWGAGRQAVSEKFSDRWSRYWSPLVIMALLTAGAQNQDSYYCLIRRRFKRRRKKRSERKGNTWPWLYWGLL